MSFDRQRLKKLIEEQDSLEGMRTAFHTIQERQKENASLIQDLEARKEKLRKVKAESIGNESLFKTAVENLKKNGFRVEIAVDDDHAISILLREIGEERLVVKSKSNISKEIDLTHRLEKKGLKVVETDLGDRIIQISGMLPVHPTGPAVHLTRYQVAKILSNHFDKKLPPDPDVLSDTVRQELDGYLSKANIGVTGSNAIAAIEGAAVIVHNEGNVTRCTQARKKHIIITTKDKIVPTLEDAINLVKLQTYYATGKIVSAHIDIISSPSYTADIEKKIFKGMHGPKDIVIIFVDSGRTEIGNSELLYCIGCGNCLLTCPVYDILGPDFGTKGHMGGIGVALTGRMHSPKEATSSGVFLCSSCGICKEQCPASIDVRPDIYQARDKAAKIGLISEEQTSALKSMRNYDNPWLQPRNSRVKWAKSMKMPSKGDIIYFPGCSIAMLKPELAKTTVGLLREAGFDPAYLEDSDICCGSIARKLGDETLFKNQIERLMNSIEESGAKQVVTSCPGCMISLNIGREMMGRKDLKVTHVAEALQKLPRKKSSGNKIRIKATYHDPCELGRGLGVYDPPRNVIDSIEGIERIELEKSKDKSACCGAGAGLKSGYPELAMAIARKRIMMAKDAGVKILITACPWCTENLQSASEGAGIEVIDLVELLDRSRFKEKAG